MTDPTPTPEDLDTARKSQDAGIADEGAAYTQASEDDDGLEEAEAQPS